MRLHIDYETRGVIDLPLAGAYAYAEDPNTSVILAAWAIDDDPFSVWNIIDGEPIPFELRLALLDPKVTIVAHNANFERCMSTIVGRRQRFLPHDVWDAIRKPERWSCTAARAAACGLPRALEKVAAALSVPNQKDMDGHRLMMEMCKPVGVGPDGDYVWLDDAPRIKRLGEYCIGDGLAERDVDKILPMLSPAEQEVWCTTERMNDRGVLIDDKLLLRMMILVRDATTYLNSRISTLTNGVVPKVTNPQKLIAWLKTEGIDTEDEGIGKWVINGLLEDESIPPVVREVLVLRRDGGKSSTAKFATIMKRMNGDGRVRGALLYAGAAATSRWSSRGVQLQNLPRGKVVKDVEAAIAAALDPGTTIVDIENRFGPPMVVASELTRPILRAPDGYWLARGDYSQIEARVNAWLAGEVKILNAFQAYDAEEGPDLYIVAASDIYGIPPSAIDKDDPRRQVGKVTILACGFGGGYKALLAMARIYHLKIAEEKAKEACSAWREANKNIVSFWYDLDRAAVACLRGQPGETHQVRSGIWFRRNDSCLAMRLPSGRYLVYWYPRLEEVETPWGDKRWAVSYYAEDSQTHKWRRFIAWHGLWCENAVQAAARDIMAEALVKMEKRDMKPILTVHDEAVCQLLKEQYPTPVIAADAVCRVMMEPPAWTHGLPIMADASAADRYVKG